MRLGSLKCHLGKHAPFNIAWPEQYVFALGVAFAYDSTTSNKINYEEKLVLQSERYPIRGGLAE